MADVVDVFPLTPVQRGMLVQWLAMPSSGFYYSHQAFAVAGRFDPELFRRAVMAAVARHESLRSAFSWRDVDAPVQVVLSDAALAFEVVDQADFGPSRMREALSYLVARDRRTRIDLEKAPLFRLSVMRLADDRHVVVWGYHHLIMDGWSIGVLVDEVLRDYAVLAGGGAPDEQPAPSFGDYVAYSLEKGAEGLAFWGSALAGIELPTPLGIDVPAPEEEDPRVFVATRDLAPGLRKAVDELARSLRVSPWAVVAAAWGLLLGRMGAQPTVVFGTTVSGRSAPVDGCERIVGNLLTVVPIRCDVAGASSVRELVTATYAFFVDAEEHQHTSAVDVRKALAIPAERPLFDSLIVFQNAPLPPTNDGVPFVIERLEARDENAELFTLNVLLESGLRLQAEYRAGRFTPEDVAATLERLEHVLTTMISSPAAAIDSVTTTGDVERRTLEAWSAPRGGDDAPFVSPLMYFDAQVRRDPDATALVELGEVMTYGALDARVNGVAETLRAKGIGRGDVVAIVSDGAASGVVGVLGALKVNAAWLPMHPDWPAARMAGVVADAKARVLLASSRRHSHVFTTQLGDGAEALDRIDLDDVAPRTTTSAPSEPAKPEDPAYVVYTSGSTGAPKGVVVDHASIHYVCTAWRRVYRLEEFPLRVLQIGNFACDVFIGDLFKALITGGSLHLTHGKDALDVTALADKMLAERITLVESTPGLCVPLFENARRRGLSFPDLRLVILGADYLRMREYLELVRTYGSTARIVNGYGLTEATIESSVFEVGVDRIETAKDAGYAPLGKPFPGTEFWVLDGQRRLAPIGVKGEVYIGGPGLARGYLGLPEATAERFRTDVLEGRRLYRTGDLGRWNWQGDVEYAGRADHQTKIRGFRVEIGEVENAIVACDGVDEVAVIVETHDGASSLTAFVVGLRPLTEVRDDVRERLPAYMVPSRMHASSALPQNANGKVDRRALLERARELRRAGGEAVVEARESARAVRAIWEDLLGRSDIASDDNFFASGGDSVLVLRLLNRLTSAFDVELSVAELFAHHSILAQADLIERRSRPPTPAPPAPAPHATQDADLRDLLDRLERGEIGVDEAGREMTRSTEKGKA